MKRPKIVRILGTYIFTWIFAFIVVMPRLLRGSFSWVKLWDRIVDLVSFSGFTIALHIAFLVFYMLLLCGGYFHAVYKSQGFKTCFRQLTLRFFFPIFMLFLLYQSIVYSNTYENFDFHWDTSIENKTGISTNNYAIDQKQRGMSVFGLEATDEVAIAELLKNNIEWVTLVPFLYQKNQFTKTMNVPEDLEVWSGRDSSFIKSIHSLHQKKIRVMLKPHLWMNEGWRSNITLNSPAEWDTWFQSYRLNMLRYAKLAEENKVELFCIGTELKSSLKNVPVQWISLVKEIKSIYKGKLTYAANWDGEFNLVPFWDEMDFVGIQAYFPLTKRDTPELLEIKNGWDRHIAHLEVLFEAHQKPILFTEIGYRSDVSTTIKPWEWNDFGNVLFEKKSNKTQQLAYEAMFQKLWHKPWFAGSYIWQWDTRSEPNSTHESLDFTPRFKPALNTISKWYGKSGVVD